MIAGVGREEPGVCHIFLLEPRLANYLLIKERPIYLTVELRRFTAFMYVSIWYNMMSIYNFAPSLTIARESTASCMTWNKFINLY